MHPGVAHLLKFFTYGHPTHEGAKAVSMGISVLATRMAKELPENPEKTAGLRKLLEAKDCFVRASLEKQE